MVLSSILRKRKQIILSSAGTLFLKVMSWSHQNRRSSKQHWTVSASPSPYRQTPPKARKEGSILYWKSVGGLGQSFMELFTESHSSGVPSLPVRPKKLLINSVLISQWN